MEIQKMKNRLRREHRKANLKEPEKVQVPVTIEDAREVDNTFVLTKDPELDEEEACDEFSKLFSEQKKSKILLTTGIHPVAETFQIVGELKSTVPNCYYYPRKDFNLSTICE